MTRPSTTRNRSSLLSLFKLRLLGYFGRPAQIRLVLCADQAYAPLVAYVAEDSITFRRSPHYR